MVANENYLELGDTFTDTEPVEKKHPKIEEPENEVADSLKTWLVNLRS